jgi:outer membrane protein insertion porin family
MKRSPAILALLLAAASLWAQAESGAAPEGPDWFWGKSIAGVQWEGLVHADRRELDTITRSYVGKEFTEELWIELQARLYELDWFEKIEPNALPADAARSKMFLKFVVSEKPAIDAVRVVGNTGIRVGEILDVVSIKAGDIYNPTKAKLDELAVRNLYLERGYPDSAVFSSSTPGSVPNSVILTFTVSEGSMVAVRQISFIGNETVPSKTLKAQMETKEKAFLRQGAFKDGTLEEDKRKIVDYYRARGYVDAAIVDVIRRLEKDPKSGKTWLVLDLVVSEGKRWTFGGIAFAGNAIFPTERLKALVDLKSGSTLDYTKLVLQKQRIDDLYYESGYIFNTIELVERRDEAALSISYEIRVVERDRAHIESVMFKGNKKTKDFVLEREMPLEVGDIFSKAKIIEGLRNLYNLQYFSMVEPEMFPGSAENLMNLVINVEEQSTADIQFGVTLSGFGDPDSFPVSGLIKWNDRNFFGNGQTFGIELNASPDEQTVSFSFNDKWLLGKRLSGGIELSFEHAEKTAAQDIIAPIFDDGVPDPYTAEGLWSGSISVIPDEYLMPYEAWQFTLGFSTGYSFRTPLGDLGFGGGFSTGYGTKLYDPSRYRPASKALRDALGDWRLGNKFLVRGYLNNLDLWYNPGKGYYLSQRLTFAGLLGYEYQHYVKSETRFEAYATLFDIPVVEGFNFKWVLGAHTGFHALVPKPGMAIKVVDDYLGIDGTFNARGWRSLYGQEGLTLWENWIELRMPIFEQFLWLDGFFDAAALRTGIGLLNVAGEDVFEDSGSPDFSYLGWDNMAFSLGFGFRFAISQFPFRFYFAKRFTFDGDAVTWKTTGSNFDFVISITTPLY